VPANSQIVPSVWAMKWKRRIQTEKVYKWKARLNMDGSKQIKGLTYWETYAPVASWPLIQLIMTTAIINKWYSKQIDFVLAYSQAEAETDNLYMEIPKGFTLNEGFEPREWVLQLKRNVYSGKAAGPVWNKHLVAKSKEPSTIASSAIIILENNL